MSIRVCGVVGGLIAALFSASFGQAQTPAPPAPAPSKRIIEKLDGYFGDPNGPDTYRALSGMGAPDFNRSPRNTRFYNGGDAETALALQLFARDAGAGYLDPNACRADYAVQVLKARIAQLGADHPYVRQWIATQRAVFSACDHGYRQEALKDVALPPPLAIGDPVLAKLQAADRAYQAAALAFYLRYDPATLAAFRKIAQSASPHRLFARYMVAAIRAGTDGENLTWTVPHPLVPPAESIAEIQAILADPNLAAIHPQAQELLGWVAANVADAPTRRAQVLASLAAVEVPGDRLARDVQAQRRYALAVEDLSHLHQADALGEPDWWLKTSGPPPEYTGSQAMMDAARTDPMAAWLLFPTPYLHGQAWAAFEGEAKGWPALTAYAEQNAAGADPQGNGVAFAWSRLLATTQPGYYEEGAWETVDDETGKAAQGDDQMIAALAFDFYPQVRRALVSGEPAGFEAALAHMKALPFRTSVLYAAARHDGLQYLMSTGRAREARLWRDALPRPAFEPDDFSAAVYGYPDAALLQILAEDEDHFVAALALNTSGAENLPLQNHLSIAALRGLAARTDVARPLRARFARIAWSRTYALGRTVDADLDRMARDLNPAMAAWTSKPGKARPNDRRVLLDVLRTPGIAILIVDTDRDLPGQGPIPEDAVGLTKIDLYNHDDDNWWCRWKKGRNRRLLEELLFDTFYGSVDFDLVDGRTAYGLRDKLNPMLASSFAFKNQDPAEIDALSKIACAPKMLNERTLGWVEHPGLFGSRDGQAEALALAVKSTRYGCYSDGPHGVYSKAAWTALRARFGQTEWAIKTKYWFNCPNSAKDCPALADD